VTDMSKVFQYGGSESNRRSIDPKELPKTPEIGDVPPQRSGSEFDIPADESGAGPVTTRLVLLALTIILLGTAAGLAGALVLPKTYGARAEVLYAVGQEQQSGDPLKQGRDLSTQLVYLKSRAVLGPVATKEGRQFKDLEKAVTVEVLDNSNVIEVEADGPTKLAALQMLQSVMDGYMTLIGQPTGVSRNLDTQLADAKQNTAQLQTRVQQLTTAVTAGTATQAALNDVRVQLTASLDREKAIQARIDELNLTGQNGPDAQLLTPPYSLPDPVFPQPLIAAGTGALVGVIVAGVVVAMSVRRRTRP
jgi:capsular polysaccharide biosynthesis protein